MADYLEEAAAELRKMRDANEGNAGRMGYDAAVRDERARIADGFTRLAAIERGLLQPDTALAAAPDGEGEQADRAAFA